MEIRVILTDANPWPLKLVKLQFWFGWTPCPWVNSGLLFIVLPRRMSSRLSRKLDDIPGTAMTTVAALLMLLLAKTSNQSSRVSLIIQMVNGSQVIPWFLWLLEIAKEEIRTLNFYFTLSKYISGYLKPPGRSIEGPIWENNFFKKVNCSMFLMSKLCNNNVRYW